MMKTMTFLVISLLATSVYTMYVPVAYAHNANPPNPITQNNWEVPWSTPSGADGVVIGNVGTGAVVKYKGAATPNDSTFTDARLPSIYVTYPSGTDVKDELGGSSWTHLHKVDVTNGFRLEATYYLGCTELQWPVNGCYKYILEWWFYSGGQMNPWMQIYGPGFTGYGGAPDNRGIPTYESRWRFNTAVFEPADDGIGIYTSTGWSKPTFEDKSSDASPYTPEGYKWKVFDWPESGENLYVDPFSQDSSVFWYLRQYSTQTEVPGDNPGGNVKGSLTSYDNDEVVQSGSGGQDNVHWYLAQSYYGNCSTSVPCYPGGTWFANSFP